MQEYMQKLILNPLNMKNIAAVAKPSSALKRNAAQSDVPYNF